MPDLKKLTEKYKKLLDPNGLFTVFKVDTVNHKPDVFVIGTKHVAHASDHCGGRLGEETMRAIPCYGCRQPYDAHTHDMVLILKVARNLTNKEAAGDLFEIKEELRKDGLAGVGFMKSDFEIAPPDKETPVDA